MFVIPAASVEHLPPPPEEGMLLAIVIAIKI